mgnify:CR=1 FL=1
MNFFDEKKGSVHELTLSSIQCDRCRTIHAPEKHTVRYLGTVDKPDPSNTEIVRYAVLVCLDYPLTCLKCKTEFYMVYYNE